MSGKSFVKKTGQMWKIYFTLVLIVLSLIPAGIAFSMTDNHNVFAVLIMLFVLLCFFGFMFGIFRINCPKCKTMLLLKSIGNHDWRDYDALGQSGKCPVCGYTGEDVSK